MPSLARGTPFTVSIHSWTKPKIPVYPGLQTRRRSAEKAAWGVRVINDGVCVAYVHIPRVTALIQAFKEDVSKLTRSTETLCLRKPRHGHRSFVSPALQSPLKPFSLRWQITRSVSIRAIRYLSGTNDWQTPTRKKGRSVSPSLHSIDPSCRDASGTSRMISAESRSLSLKESSHYPITRPVFKRQGASLVLRIILHRKASLSGSDRDVQVLTSSRVP